MVLALLLAPLSPAIFASSSRSSRVAALPAPRVARIAEAEDVIVAEIPEPTAHEEAPPRVIATRNVQSLTGRSATPWIPPSVWATALSPDGRFKLEARSAGDATRITLFNLSDGFRVDLSSDGITCVSFAGDGRFASGHQDGNVRVWDSATGGIALSLKGSDAAITSVAFSRDGQLVAAGTTDGQLLVWEVGPGDDRTRYSRYELAQQATGISSVRWSPADDRLAVSVGAWNAAQPAELLIWSPADDLISRRLPLPRPAGAIAWLGGDAVIAADWDGIASVWQLADGELASRMELDKNSLSAAAWSPDCPLVPRGRVQELFQGAP